MSDWSTAAGVATEAGLESTATVTPSYVSANIDGPLFVTTGGQTITNWTLTEEGGDLEGSFDPVTGVFTCPKDATVRVTIKMEWDADTSGSVRFFSLTGLPSFRRTEMLRSVPLVVGGYGQTICVTGDLSEGETLQGGLFLSAAGAVSLTKITLLLTELKADA